VNPPVDLKKHLEDIKIGTIPDFGFQNDLTFASKPVGWHLFIDLIRNYPRHTRLIKYMEQLRYKKRLEVDLKK
jgi:hypothetical protein